jgi:hypothetical protein
MVQDVGAEETSPVAAECNVFKGQSKPKINSKPDNRELRAQVMTFLNQGCSTKKEDIQWTFRTAA